MKTINDIDIFLKPLFEELIFRGWKQPNKGYKNDFVLQNDNGITAHQLDFPRPHLGLISKGGTILLGGATDITELSKIIHNLKLNNKL